MDKPSQSLALSQRQDEEANERQRLAMLDAKEGEQQAPAQNESEDTPKDGSALQPTDFSKAVPADDSRKEGSQRICMSNFNRGLEDGSFHLVEDAQFDNHKNGHGFTMPAPEDQAVGPALTGPTPDGPARPAGHRASYGQGDLLAEEGSHVLYADAHNVHFSSVNNPPRLSHRSQHDLHGSERAEEKWRLATQEDRNSKRSKQASKNFSKVNDPTGGSATPSGLTAPGHAQEEGDKESDLETLTKLFKPEDRAQAEAAQEQQLADFNLAKQQYSEMKRLPTSQGPRTVKYLGQNPKSHQSQPQPAANKAE